MTWCSVDALSTQSLARSKIVTVGPPRWRREALDLSHYCMTAVVSKRMCAGFSRVLQYLDITTCTCLPRSYSCALAATRPTHNMFTIVVSVELVSERLGIVEALSRTSPQSRTVGEHLALLASRDIPIR